MNDIIKKRQDLINFFKNENNKYTKEDILNKEFCVLSFSPQEDLLENVATIFDDKIENIYDILKEKNINEVYLKGLVTNVDNKKEYAIIHLFTPESETISVSFDKDVFEKYIQYLNTGEMIIIKAHMYQQKFYAHFVLKNEENFISEIEYINGSSLERIMNFEQDNVGLVRQCKNFVSKKGNKCFRFEIYNNKGDIDTIITCENYKNLLPRNIYAGDFIVFEKGDNPTFVNNVKKMII